MEGVLTFIQSTKSVIHLTVNQSKSLVEFIRQKHTDRLTKQLFIEVVLDLFEDVSGMENVTPSDSHLIINKLWNIYIMNSFAPQSPAPTQALSTKSTPSNPALYKEAIRVGKQTLLSEGSKASAARLIFNLLKNESRDAILQAFIEGADITPKGSPTYFYNINKKLKKPKI